jgi:hypothetical protein
MAGDHVSTGAGIPRIDRIRVIADVNDISPSHRVAKKDRKNHKFVHITQPLAQTLDSGADSAKERRRTNNLHLMASLRQALSHQGCEPLHAFLLIPTVVPYQ